MARHVPYLKREWKDKRRDWAELVKGIEWSEVIWSDKCYMYLGDHSGQVFVTCHEDDEYEEDCLVPTFKQSTICVMVWACIMKGKKGPRVVLEYPGGKGGGGRMPVGTKNKCLKQSCCNSGNKWVQKEVVLLFSRMAHQVILQN